jgi:chromatin remodeling complex protein RSC6
MVKASKTPLTVSASESTDVVIKTAVPKVKKEKKSAPVVVVAETETETVVLEEPATDKAIDETEVVNNVPTRMADFTMKLQAVISLLSATKVSFKALEKVVIREFKVSQKASSKKSKRSGNRQPSGFIIPTLISDELALFLGKEVGSEMARTAVSREINQYVRANNLQDAKNGRQINFNAELKTLLKLQDEDTLTYFNLQRYMKHHFIKAVPAEVVAAVVV